MNINELKIDDVFFTDSGVKCKVIDKKHHEKINPYLKDKIKFQRLDTKECFFLHERMIIRLSGTKIQNYGKM